MIGNRGVDARRRRRQLGEEAASYVRDLITSGTLRPGEQVRPEVIATELDISTTPAREALQSLRAEGFLELTPRRGFRVMRLAGDDIRDLFMAQALVAGELAARAAKRRTPEELVELERIHASVLAAADRGDLVELEERNHVFHRALNIAAAAPRLAWVVGLLSRYTPRRFYAEAAGWRETTTTDHDVLMAAVRSGDAEQARSIMVEHVRSAGDLLARHVDQRRLTDETS